jgi:hypothetical protein
VETACLTVAAAHGIDMETISSMSMGASVDAVSPRRNRFFILIALPHQQKAKLSI